MAPKLLLLSLLAATCFAKCPVIKTDDVIYTGVRLNPSVDAYLGVPYAEPPIGDLRFAPPQPLEYSESPAIIDARAFGPVCHQFNFKTVLGNNIITTTGEDEDCLTLNIFVPSGKRASRELLPVYAWSYGGGFAEGGASAPLFNPEEFVANSEDIIVVTWNYRLNIFGFPAAPNEPANLGIRDIRFALEWLSNNVEAFGGDPSRIVLGGQSAGSDAAHAMMYTHADEPLVAGLILQSGVAQYIGEGDGSEWGRIAGAVGCAEADLACMREKSALDLKLAITNKTFNQFSTPSGGTPVVDNQTHLLTMDYMQRGAEGRFAKVPTLLGITDDEGDGSIPWSPTGGVNASFSEDLTSTYFNCPVAAEAGFRAQHGIPVWRYRYMGVFPSVTFYNWLGSYHQADIPIVFGSFDNLIPRKEVLPEEVAASRYIQKAFASFIRDPMQGLTSEMGWPQYDPNEPTLVELFRDNEISAKFVDPSVYDAICTNPRPSAGSASCSHPRNDRIIIVSSTLSASVVTLPHPRPLALTIMRRDSGAHYHKNPV